MFTRCSSSLTLEPPSPVVAVEMWVAVTDATLVGDGFDTWLRDVREMGEMERFRKLTEVGRMCVSSTFTAVADDDVMTLLEFSVMEIFVVDLALESMLVLMALNGSFLNTSVVLIGSFLNTSKLLDLTSMLVARTSKVS